MHDGEKHPHPYKEGHSHAQRHHGLHAPPSSYLLFGLFFLCAIFLAAAAFLALENQNLHGQIILLKQQSSELQKSLG
ncbi:MAG: hypothetical protein N3F07_03580, partial [Candidatus Micrarchaeota archaeon]|nr:hypothetical protein [Candidatus Micrarchaeota archaeon]